MITTAKYITQYPLNLNSTYVATVNDDINTFSWIFHTASSIGLTGHHKYTLTDPTSKTIINLEINIQ